jgi:hypothetical protein
MQATQVYLCPHMSYILMVLSIHMISNNGIQQFKHNCWIHFSQVKCNNIFLIILFHITIQMVNHISLQLDSL